MDYFLLLAMSAGVVVLCWYDSRRRRGDDPLPPARPQDLPDTLVAFAAGAMLWWFLFGLAGALLGDSQLYKNHRELTDLLASQSVNLIAALAVLRWATRRPRPPAASPWRSAATGFVAAFAVFAIEFALGLVIQAVYTLLQRVTPEQGIVLQAQRAGGLTAAAYAVTAVVVAPFAEEVFFRGTLLPAAVRIVGARQGLLLQAVVFGAIHVAQTPSSWPLAIPLAVVGWCAGFVYLRTGSLLAPILLHATFNALNFAALRAGEAGS